MVSAATLGGTLRVAAYNVNLDSGNTDPGNTTIEKVLEEMSAETYQGMARPLDILGLEETTSNTASVDPMVTTMNANATKFGGALYADTGAVPDASHPISFQATQAGGATSGNGPSAIIYNTKSLTLIAATGVSGTPNSGAAGARVSRQVARYEFRPVGGSAANDFYVYVTHMKSSVSDTGTDLNNDYTDRTLEAQLIRDDESTLPATASVIYMGDMNMSGTNDVPSPNPNNTPSAYQVLTATNSPGTNGTSVKAQGAGVDPANPTNVPQTWDSNNAFKTILSESTSTLSYRDDLQLMTANVYNGTAPSGLKFLSEHVFGNDGTVSAGATYNPTGLYAADKADLKGATDHLPIEADYSITVPEPGSLAVVGVIGAAMVGRRRR